MLFIKKFSFFIFLFSLKTIHSIATPKPLNATLEVLLIVDNTVVNKYVGINKTVTGAIQAIREVYTHIFKQVDQKFQNSFSNDPDLNLNIKLINILVYRNESDTPWINDKLVGDLNVTSNAIDANAAVTILANTMNLRQLSFEYDYALAITQKDLWIKTESTISSVYVSSACGSNRYGIMEDMGFNGVVPIAHDIAHALNALHDGYAKNLITKTCSESSNYIMIPAVGLFINNLTNLNYFSNCSKTMIKSFVTPSDRSCLFNQNNIIPLTTNTRLPGTIWDINSQCKLIYGASSSYSKCQINNDPICSSLFCYNSSKKRCSGTTGLGAIDGTSCGVNKICYNFQCINNDIVLI